MVTCCNLKIEKARLLFGKIISTGNQCKEIRRARTGYVRFVYSLFITGILYLNVNRSHKIMALDVNHDTDVRDHSHTE